ncbi:MAG: DUF1080 domain-containing protein [Verrucomicrobia bacterium]|nr:MAG: DUF1080 domain-containing protein [Verrucomicrobiota bacterium]
MKNIRRSLAAVVLSVLPLMAAENPFLGNWALTIPGGQAGWLGVSETNGQLQASMLWAGGSPFPLSSVKVEGATLVLTRSHVDLKKMGVGRPVPQRELTMYRATLDGDTMSIATETKVDGKITAKAQFPGKRIVPPGAAPDLSQIKFSEPIELFNGKNLTGWRLTDPKAASGWSVKEGLLVNNVPAKKDKHYGNLRTDREFEDFNLTLEVRVPEHGNSGVYLRGIYEVQVFDSYGKPVDCHNMGAIYGRIAPTVAAEKKPGEWQTLDITLVERHATVILNGTKIIDNQPILGCTGGALTSDEFKPGPIYLQGDHTGVEYRHVVLRPAVK